MPSQRNSLQQYQQDGYLLFPDFADAKAVATLRQRAGAIVDAFEPENHASIFSTDRQKHAVEQYFMESGDKIRCFFEEHAFDASGRLKQEKALSINKIGHALHDLDPVFDAFSRTPALARIAHDIGLQQPQIWQSMYIFKQPGIGGEVGWHQDATFFDSDPITVTTFWFALEDATQGNGCLWLQPGSHRGPLRERFVRTGATARLEKIDATPWPTRSDAIPIEVLAGTLIVFHGLLPHYSAANLSPQSRHAYTIHVVDGASTYSPRNWIQRGAEFPVRGFSASGTAKP